MHRSSGSSKESVRQEIILRENPVVDAGGRTEKYK